MKNKVKTTKPKKKSIFVFFIKNIIKLIDKSIVMPISKFFDKISCKFNKNGNKLERFLVKKNTMIFLSLIIAIIICSIVAKNLIQLLVLRQTYVQQTVHIIG